MKLVRRISTVAILVFFSIGGAGALILLHGCADAKMLLKPSQWFSDLHTAIPFLALGCLLFGAIVLILWMRYFISHVVRTLRQSEDFIRETLSGNIPGRLSTEGIRDDEIVSFFSTLNFMRDRQVNLAERLRQQREGEEKLRQEIEFFDDLQLAVFSRLLPEMRRSAGVVKAYTLIELARARREQPDDLDDRTMLVSLRRQAALSRELDFLTDVVKLERKRWSAPRRDRISTIELVQELNSRCQLALKSREITFICAYHAGTPAYISSDRELLYRLLYLLIRSAARSLMRGSQVTLTLSGREKQAVFEISDRGEDSHRENLAENYQKYFSGKAPLPDITDCSLSTIGLALVKSIAGKLDSSFEVDSTPEIPSTLRMIVPAAAAADEQTEKNPLLMHKPPAAGAVLQKKSQETPLAVLLYADDPEETDAFTRLFAYANIHLTACTGKEELTALLKKEKNTDGVIISADIGAENPRKLISHLRSTAGDPELPVLLVLPVHRRELASELELIPGVWCLVAPLNFAQAAELLRHGKSA
ncbi:MAG: HAMP domain-containing histidine kinase [Lentisphaeria bacterium]|nr:HAMP domain-containing histidine kinase [Lentisphaeria bacterium]